MLCLRIYRCYTKEKYPYKNVYVAVGRKTIGQYMKDCLRLRLRVQIPVLNRENDTSEIQRIKRLVERMIRPEAKDRCKIAEVCHEIQRIRGKPL